MIPPKLKDIYFDVVEATISRVQRELGEGDADTVLELNELKTQWMRRVQARDFAEDPEVQNIPQKTRKKRACTSKKASRSGSKKAKQAKITKLSDSQICVTNTARNIELKESLGLDDDPVPHEGEVGLSPFNIVQLLSEDVQLKREGKATAEVEAEGETRLNETGNPDRPRGAASPPHTNQSSIIEGELMTLKDKSQSEVVNDKKNSVDSDAETSSKPGLNLATDANPLKRSKDNEESNTNKETLEEMLRQADEDSKIYSNKEELDSSDSELNFILKNDDEEEVEQFILCEVTSKRMAPKDCWKFLLQNGVVVVRGREYWFHKATCQLKLPS